MLDNKVIVISGATGGLGRVVTKIMANNGASLVLLGRSKERLNSLAESLSLKDDKHLKLEVDLSDRNATEDAAKTTFQTFGKVDILLQLVGGWIGGKSIMDVEPSEISTMLKQHTWTTYHLTKSFLPYMLENHFGRIIAISSPFAATPRAKGAPYAIGKAAQEALILTLAQEIKGTGVTANILLVKTIDLDHKRDLKPSSKNAAWSKPEEIAETIGFLISDDARMINGARIPLYGSP